jgi:hypothetical protein
MLWLGFFWKNRRLAVSTMVIVRAMENEPVRLIAVRASNRIVYVANPDSMQKIESGVTEPVGVPREDVFEYDQKTFLGLKEQWTSGNKDPWPMASHELRAFRGDPGIQ